MDWIAWAWENAARIGGVMVIVGAAVSPFLTGWLNHFAEKWMSSRFDARLKEIEHQHDAQVRHLQSQIDREFDRAVRLHTKEFETLAAAWDKIYESYWRAREICSSFQRTVDFGSMGPAQTTEYIANCGLSQWQKDELAALGSAEERNKYHWNARKWALLGEGRTACSDVIKFVERNSIFMRPEIKKKMLDLNGLVAEALIEYELNIPERYRGERYAHEKAGVLVDRGEPLLKEIEAEIHERLWSSSVTQLPKE